MARSIKGGRPDLPKAPPKPYRDIILDKVTEQLTFVMAHKQVLTNDIRHIEANVLMRGKSLETHPYVILLRELMADQDKVIDTISKLIDCVLNNPINKSELDEVFKVSKNLVDTIGSKFRDYAVMKSSEYVFKYQK